MTRMEAGSLPDRKADAGSGRIGWVLDDFCRHDAARAANLLREEARARSDRA